MGVKRGSMVVRHLEGFFLPRKTEDSAGVHKFWGIGKGFEIGVHSKNTTNACKIFGM